MADVKVRAILRKNTDLSGLFPTPSGVPLEDGDLVLPLDQQSPLENDFHRARPGPWEKATDVTLSEFMRVRVREGPADESGGSSWALATLGDPDTGAVARGQQALVWAQETKLPRSVPGAGLEDVGGVFGLRSAPDLQGTYRNPTITLDDRRQIEDIESQPASENTLVGLRVSRTGPTQIRAEPGVAWVPGTGLVTLRTAIVKNLLGLTPNAWHHAYLFFNADTGEGDVEVTTVAPDAPYLGGARVKGPSGQVAADATRRLVDEFFVAANGQIRPRARLSDGFAQWSSDKFSTRRAGSGLVALVGTDLDVSPWAPLYADGIWASATLFNTDNASTFHVSAVGDGHQTVGGSQDAGQLSVFVGASERRQSDSGPISFAGSTLLRHRQTGGGASRSAHIDVAGYYRRLS